MESTEVDGNDEFSIFELPNLDLPQVEKERTKNDSFMTDLVKVANEVNKLVILVSGVVPQKKIDQEKFDVLRGHLVRMFKLYDSFLFLVVEKRSEIAFIILRSLSETIINFQYLLKYIDTDVHKKYKRASLAYENKLKNTILTNVTNRKSKLPIEERMLESIEKTFSRAQIDNLEENELKKTLWGLKPEHLEISGKAEDVGLYNIYENLFQISSHYVHGSWHELDFDHLDQKKDSLGFRKQQMRYTNPKPQLIESSSILVLGTLQNYLPIILLKSPEFNELNNYIETIKSWFYDMANKHEQFLQSPRYTSGRSLKKS